MLQPIHFHLLTERASQAVHLTLCLLERYAWFAPRKEIEDAIRASPGPRKAFIRLQEPQI